MLGNSGGGEGLFDRSSSITAPLKVVGLEKNRMQVELLLLLRGKTFRNTNIQRKESSEEGKKKPPQRPTAL